MIHIEILHAAALIPRLTPLVPSANASLISLRFCILISLSAGAVAQQETQEVKVTSSYGQSTGTADAASSGIIKAAQIKERALQRPADILEYIPGLVVSQHSGEGKANQYFLRGFNLDHGTDFATTVNGVPVNMPTHAHGQGYSDLNFLIPELVQLVEYRKGPYFASNGDFSSAGSANFIYRTQLEQPFTEVTAGQRGYLRGVAAGSKQMGDGTTLLVAIERLNNNGPWTTPEGLRKTNALLTLSGGTQTRGWSTSLTSYRAQWNATDQIPQRLLDQASYQGQPFGRFDAVDPSDAGSTTRHSLSGQWHDKSGSQITLANWYAVQYKLGLFSNFTFNTLGAAGDQFAQMDQRKVIGGGASKAWLTDLPSSRLMVNTLGMQLRQDRVQVGLMNSTQRQITSTLRSDAVTQTMVAVYGQNEMTWSTNLRTVLGLRWDQLDASVTNAVNSALLGQSQAHRFSPKLSMIFEPWKSTELFFNAGSGFHSNDARTTSLALNPAAGLVRSYGQEIGLKTKALRNFQTSLAYWRLDMDSELIYQGDAGSTVAGRPSKRRGIELGTQWAAKPWLSVDSNFGWTTAHYADASALGDRIPGAIEKAANLAFVIKNNGPWSGSLGVRYIGGASITQDGSVRSTPSVTTNLHVANKVSSKLELSLDVFNLANRRNNDITYFYSSQVQGEAAAVADTHLHPAEPRTLRLTAKISY
jgi:outer membrane cobalamin receptor